MRLGRCKEWFEVWLAASCDWCSSGVNTMSTTVKHLHQWPEIWIIMHCYPCHMWGGAGSEGAAEVAHRRAQLSPSAKSEAFSCFFMEYALSFHISDFKKGFTMCTSSCRCKCWELSCGPVSVNVSAPQCLCAAQKQSQASSWLRTLTKILCHWFLWNPNFIFASVCVTVHSNYNAQVSAGFVVKCLICVSHHLAT